MANNGNNDMANYGNNDQYEPYDASWNQAGQGGFDDTGAWTGQYGSGAGGATGYNQPADYGQAAGGQGGQAGYGYGAEGGGYAASGQNYDPRVDHNNRPSTSANMYTQPANYGDNAPAFGYGYQPGGHFDTYTQRDHVTRAETLPGQGTLLLADLNGNAIGAGPIRPEMGFGRGDGDNIDKFAALGVKPVFDGQIHKSTRWYDKQRERIGVNCPYCAGGPNSHYIYRSDELLNGHRLKYHPDRAKIDSSYWNGP